MSEFSKQDKKRMADTLNDSSPDKKRYKLEVGTSSFAKLEEKLLKRILEYLTPAQAIQYISPVSRALHQTVFSSFSDITLSYEEWSQFDDCTQRLIRFASSLPNLQSLTVDGFDNFNDMVLNNLLRKCIQSTFTELHVRECNLINPRIKHDSLQTLRISFCPNLATLAIQSPSLENLEMFDCDFEKAPKLTQCPKLNTIKLNRCKKLTDQKLSSLLKQFLPSNLTANSQEEEEGNEQKKENSAPIVPQSLRKLCLTECEPLSNPIIHSTTIVDLRLINCQLLHNPLITCSALQNLQLTWCENLENLTLGCDDLRTLDLTGAGVNMSHGSQEGSSTVRESILAAIKSHYGDQVNVTY